MSNNAADFAGDMPSYGCSALDPSQENLRADEFYILLADQSHQLARLGTVRTLLAADYGTMMELAEKDERRIYNDLRNAQTFFDAGVRVIKIAIEQFTDVMERREIARMEAANDAA